MEELLLADPGNTLNTESKRYTDDSAIVKTKEISDRTRGISLRGFCFTELRAVDVAIAFHGHDEQTKCRKENMW